MSHPRFIVVNVPGGPQELYEDVYCQRGDMENRIKEQQLDLFADRTSCHRFLANQFRLLLSSAAYVLVQALRRDGVAGDGPRESSGQDDPTEAPEGRGEGRRLGPSGRVSPGNQLPICRSVSGRIRACHGPSHPGEGGSGLTRMFHSELISGAGHNA